MRITSKLAKILTISNGDRVQVLVEISLQRQQDSEREDTVYLEAKNLIFILQIDEKIKIKNAR